MKQFYLSRERKSTHYTLRLTPTEYDHYSLATPQYALNNNLRFHQQPETNHLLQLGKYNVAMELGEILYTPRDKAINEMSVQ